MLMCTRSREGGREVAIVPAGYRPERQRGFALLLTVLMFCLPLVLIALLSWRTVVAHAPVAPHVAAFGGVLVPVTLKRLGFDPALAGGVILTTLTDVMGFLSFLGLATLILLP